MQRPPHIRASFATALLLSLLMNWACAEGGIVTGADDDDAGDDDATGDDDDATGDDDTTTDGPIDFEGIVELTVDAWGVISLGYGSATATLDAGVLDGDATIQFDTMGSVTVVAAELDASVSGDAVVGTLAIPLSEVEHWLDDMVLDVDGEYADGRIETTLYATDGQGVVADGEMLLTAL